MFRNFFIGTFRKIVRNRAYTAINILGLSLGTTVAIIIFLIVRYDLDFDAFHSKKDRIYRVVHTSESSGVLDYHANIPYPAGYDFDQSVQGVELYTEIHHDDDRMVEVLGEKSRMDGVILIDSNFFKVFDYEVLIGNPEESMKKVNTALLSESTARSYFGEPYAAVGKNIRLANLMDLEITGIVKDPPASGHLQFNMLVSFPSLTDEYVGGFPVDNWGVSLAGYLYALLPDQIDKESVEGQINQFIAMKQEEDEAVTNYTLQPLEEIHFDANYARYEFSPTVDRSYLYILILIGVFIILIASINFVNLSTALSIKRAKEVGIKKSLGAFKGNLILQFLGETFVIVLISILFSMGMVERLLPMISSFLDKQLFFNLIQDPRIPLFLFSLLLGITLLAGLYPAILISGFSPLQALRVTMNAPSGKSLSVRRFLVVFQFIISQALVIGSIVIISQLNFFQSKPLGFNKDRVVLMDLFERDSAQLVTLGERLRTHTDIEAVSFGTGVPTSMNSLGTSLRRMSAGENDFIRTRIKAVDNHYLKTFDLEMVAGSWLQENQPASYGIVINQAAAKELGFDSPDAAIGEFVHLGVRGLEGPVIGVVRDFHSRTLHREIGPMALFPMHDFYFEAGIKVTGNNMEETLSFIVDQWEQVFPGYMYEYAFMDDTIEEMYAEEEKLLIMANAAALFSILIGCLGLYGLVSFMVIQKTKEVGIRKAIGASVGHIVLKFSSEFFVLLTISFILSVPLVWVLMSQWLEGFAYHIALSPLFFIFGYVGSIAVAGLTVGYKSWSAARINPVDALKEE
jgi:ABC-type antimicrobial peptide transport system permease subunit